MDSLKVILTDLDGVIRHWNSDSIHEKEIECGFNPGYLYSVCFEATLLSQVITGRISDDEWRNQVHIKLSASVSESLAKELIDCWTHSEVQIDKKVIEICKDHYPNVKVVLTTNATSRLNQDLKNQGLDSVFDEVFNSSEMGVSKPSHSYFNKVLSKLGVKPEEVIYIDDSVKNVKSAEQLSIRSHHYKNHAQIVEFLVDTQKIFS